MSSECLFCRLVKGEIPAQKVFEDEEILAFRDINPQAPIHILVIPKRHLSSLADFGEADRELLGRLQLAVRRVAEEQVGPGQDYRLVLNSGESAGQSVFHLHYHLLGGRTFRWPPG
ncbi:MAG TPA: histidine triad nucleotide-binding protein [bacterium]|uniref:HIT-like protein n=1 Tax=candidate division TA06 bacterium ADurb.Bin417 TaxID=1852828 RepID=A0A1V5M8V5_UNCT6|nr:MAG: HIT-like protein [candidate division TA06 bacterium ADurb.Bin417]HNQ35274.1 histidine triad nucleotide-binding protein [bacterium]HNS49068.1 histidine triad nucleotide-binding protein [bacterium]